MVPKFELKTIDKVVRWSSSDWSLCVNQSSLLRFLFSGGDEFETGLAVY